MRARNRFLVFLAAAATLALLAFLLLRGGGVSVPAPGEGEAAPRAGTGADRGRVEPSRTPPAAGAASAAAPVPGGPTLELRAVVGGDWGLAGVQVLAVERFRDGSLVAMIGDDAPDGGETDGEGRITLRYKSEPAERLFAILPDGAEFDSAGNAEPAGEIPPFRVFRASSMGPVTLRFRDPDGAVLLRPVDAATGEALAGREGAVFVVNRMEQQVANAPRGGWIRGPAAPGATFILPGFLPAPGPPGGWKGRVVLPMTVDPRAVSGTLVAPPGEGWELRFVILDARTGAEIPQAGFLDGLESPKFRVAALQSGPFALTVDVPGKYSLRARWTRAHTQGSDAWWAEREFGIGERGVDLGWIKPVQGVELRARILAPATDDPARRPELQVLVHHGGVPAVSVGYGDRRSSPRLTAWPGGHPNSWENVEPEGVDEEGLWRWAGFRPGTEVILAAPSHPGVWKRVRLPTEPGGVATAELDVREPTTDCAFHFTIDGSQPVDWGKVLAGPCYDEDFKSGTGVLEAAIPLGRHRIVVEATMDEEGGGVSLYEVEFELKSAGRWETTFDLVPVKR